jgi:hypothetical protein
VEFEWDPRKARENEAKHGVSFELAKTAFDDPGLVLAEDAEHSAGEQRYFAFGKAGGGILTVRFTLRADRVRIIGAGYWNRGKVYYEQTHRLRR